MLWKKNNNNKKMKIEKISIISTANTNDSAMKVPLCEFSLDNLECCVGGTLEEFHSTFIFRCSDRTLRKIYLKTALGVVWNNGYGTSLHFTLNRLKLILIFFLLLKLLNIHMSMCLCLYCIACCLYSVLFLLVISSSAVLNKKRTTQHFTELLMFLFRRFFFSKPLSFWIIMTGNVSLPYIQQYQVYTEA